jgi:hypothetical protein
MGTIMAVVAIGVIAYYVARYLKGKLTLELPVKIVDSNQVLSGKLTVHAKKNIDGLLIVSLVGRIKQKKGRNDSSEWVDVYRRDSVLEEQRIFPVGYTQQYPFEFTAPTSTEVRCIDEIIKSVANKVGGAIGIGIKLTVAVLGIRQGRIYWHVEARLDAEGVDLYTKQKIRVNLKMETKSVSQKQLPK